EARELDAVLHEPQEAVVATELARLRPADVAALGESVERVEGRTLPDPVVHLAVHELQQLDRELDVAPTARSELELHDDLVGGEVLQHALPHPLHRLARKSTRLNSSHVKSA